MPSELKEIARPEHKNRARLKSHRARPALKGGAEFAALMSEDAGEVNCKTGTTAG